MGYVEGINKLDPSLSRINYYNRLYHRAISALQSINDSILPNVEDETVLLESKKQRLRDVHTKSEGWLDLYRLKKQPKENIASEQSISVICGSIVTFLDTASNTAILAQFKVQFYDIRRCLRLVISICAEELSGFGIDIDSI